MKSASKISAILLSLLFCGPAFSESPADALSACMVDNLNGKERKSLARWIFFGIGAHPEISSHLNASSEDIRASNEYVGTLITRLLTVDCAGLLKRAYSSDPTSVEKAFEIVGRVAMQELTTSNEVEKALTQYVQFADIAKINKIMSQK